MNTAFWYASRATGIVALLLLTAVLVLGILVNRQGRLPGLPRFAVTDLHRNLSLLSVAFIAVHVLTAVLDTYVHIPLVSAVIPFASGYERLWLALGAISLDIMLAMIVTSLLRGRLNRILWRAVHLLAYASWPVAFAHSIGSSKDLQQGWMLDVAIGCAMIVLAAVIWRLAHAARQVPRAGRVAAVFAQHSSAEHGLGGQAGSQDGGAMSAVMNQSAPGGAARQAAGLPRLLPAAPEDLHAHLARYGPDPYRSQPGALIADVEASGLTGRGGAAFPVHRKLAAVARAGLRQGRKVVVANGAESEPASRKDETPAAARAQPRARRPAADRRGGRRHRGAPVPAPRARPADPARAGRTGRPRPGPAGRDDHAGPAAVPGRPGDRGGEPARRRPGAAHRSSRRG